MKTKIQLVDKQGSGRDVIIHGQFNAGRLYENDPSKQNIVLSMDVSKVKEAMRQVLRQHIPTEFVGDWDSDLIEYVKLCMLEQLGVSSHPLIMKGGIIAGFKNGYEVIPKESVCLD